MAEKKNFDTIEELIESFNIEYENSFTNFNTMISRLNDEELPSKKEKFLKVLSDNIKIDFFEFEGGKNKYMSLFIGTKMSSNFKMEKINELFNVKGNLYMNKGFNEKKTESSNKTLPKTGGKLVMCNITKIHPYLQYFIEFIQNCMENLNYNTLNVNDPVLQLQAKTQKYLISKNLFSKNQQTRKIQFNGLGTPNFPQMNIKSLIVNISFYFNNLSVTYEMDKKKYKLISEESPDTLDKLLKWVRENNDNYSTTNYTTSPSRLTIQPLRFTNSKIYEKYNKDYEHLSFFSDFSEITEKKYREDKLLTVNFGFECRLDMVFKNNIETENALSEFLEIVEETLEEKEIKIKALHNEFTNILDSDIKKYFVTKTSDSEILKEINKLNLPKIENKKPKIESYIEENEEDEEDEYDDEEEK